MNNTKWKELQESMYRLASSPQWRTKCIDNGYISVWDGEWYYHFSEGGFKDIEWVEIQVIDCEHKNLVLRELKLIHVPGIETEFGFRIYGFVKEGEYVNYL